MSSNQKPAFRVMRARVKGRDSNGRAEYGSFRAIGAVWHPDENKKWSPMPLDLIPIELTQREAVLYLAPVEDTQDEQQQDPA